MRQLMDLLLHYVNMIRRHHKKDISQKPKGQEEVAADMWGRTKS